VIAIRERVAGSLDEKRDAGFTIIELIAAMAIFSVFIAVVMGSIFSITRASTKVQVTAQSTTAEISAFERLDREIRYSDAINFPGTGGTGDMYIEFRTPASSEASGITLCTQWRYDLSSRSLQVRFWNDGASAGATWQTLMTNMPNDGGATYPFAMVPATNGGATNEQLKLTLDAGNTNIKGAAITSTFVARNSSTSSPSNHDDVVTGKSDIPICTGATRP
jgi:prepilin-type N-terminal cleavage/methylation domain-containing protein